MAGLFRKMQIASKINKPKCQFKSEWFFRHWNLRDHERISLPTTPPLPLMVALFGHPQDLLLFTAFHAIGCSRAGETPLRFENTVIYMLFKPKHLPPRVPSMVDQESATTRGGGGRSLEVIIFQLIKSAVNSSPKLILCVWPRRKPQFAQTHVNSIPIWVTKNVRT